MKLIVSLTILLPVLQSTNNFTGNKRWQYKQYKDSLHNEVKPQLSILRRNKPITHPIKMRYTFYKKGRAFDLTNYSATIKIIEDLLVDAGFIKDDSPKYIPEVEIRYRKSADNRCDIDFIDLE